MFEPEVLSAARKLLTFFPIKIQFENGEQRICESVNQIPYGIAFKVIGTKTGEGTTSDYRTIERI